MENVKIQNPKIRKNLLNIFFNKIKNYNIYGQELLVYYVYQITA